METGLTPIVESPKQISCAICTMSFRRITAGHLALADHREKLLPGIEEPTSDDLMRAYRRLVSVDEEIALNPYVPALSTEDLQLFRQDLRRERRLGIKDRVYCRECGIPAYRLTGANSHLERRHNWTAQEYLAKWPKAPLRSSKYSEKEAGEQLKRRREDPEGSRVRELLCYANNPRPAIERARRWAAEHPEKRKKISRDYQDRVRQSGEKSCTRDKGQSSKLTKSLQRSLPDCQRILQPCIHVAFAYSHVAAESLGLTSTNTWPLTEKLGWNTKKTIRALCGIRSVKWPRQLCNCRKELQSGKSSRGLTTSRLIGALCDRGRVDDREA
jgi:hypothetical protein